jgi:hypothetical protein
VGAPLFGAVARVKRAAEVARVKGAVEVANGDELVSMAIVEGAVPALVGKNKKEIGPSIGGGGSSMARAQSWWRYGRQRHGSSGDGRHEQRAHTRVGRGGSGQRRSLVGRLLWTWPDEQYGFSFNSNFQTNSNLQWFKTYLPLL